MITYKDLGDYQISVFLDGKRVGSILSNDGVFWWYKPKNGLSGEVFNSVAEVKRSLESD